MAPFPGNVLPENTEVKMGQMSNDSTKEEAFLSLLTQQHYRGGCFDLSHTHTHTELLLSTNPIGCNETTGQAAQRCTETGSGECRVTLKTKDNGQTAALMTALQRGLLADSFTETGLRERT